MTSVSFFYFKSFCIGVGKRNSRYLSKSYTIEFICNRECSFPHIIELEIWPEFIIIKIIFFFTEFLCVVPPAVSYTHLRAHETPEHLVCRLLLEKKKHN